MILSNPCAQERLPNFHHIIPFIARSQKRLSRASSPFSVFGLIWDCSICNLRKRSIRYSLTLKSGQYDKFWRGGGSICRFDVRISQGLGDLVAATLYDKNAPPHLECIDSPQPRLRLVCSDLMPTREKSISLERMKIKSDRCC